MYLGQEVEGGSGGHLCDTLSLSVPLTLFCGMLGPLQEPQKLPRSDLQDEAPGDSFRASYPQR